MALWAEFYPPWLKFVDQQFWNKKGVIFRYKEGTEVPEVSQMWRSPICWEKDMKCRNPGQVCWFSQFDPDGANKVRMWVYKAWWPQPLPCAPPCQPAILDISPKTISSSLWDLWDVRVMFIIYVNRRWTYSTVDKWFWFWFYQNGWAPPWVMSSRRPTCLSQDSNL